MRDGYGCYFQRHDIINLLLRPIRIFSLVAFSFAHLLSFGLQSVAQNLSASSGQPRIVAPIDDASLVVLHGNTHPLARPEFDRGPAPVSMSANRLLLVLARSKQHEVAL